jgi:hypothetical protein
LSDVCWTGKEFIVISQDTILTSEDGSTWRKIESNYGNYTDIVGNKEIELVYSLDKPKMYKLMK